MTRKQPEPKPRLIDAQNRIAIPAEILKHLGVKKGDYIAFTVENGDVKLRRVKWIAE